MDDFQLCSMSEAARLLGGISISTVERMVSRGDLRGVKVGLRRKMIVKSSLLKVIQEEKPREQGRAELLTA